MFTNNYFIHIFFNMEVYVSINGVLRNLIQKFDYHYKSYYLDEPVGGETFDYNITSPVFNDDLMKYYSFQSEDEYKNFLYIEFPLEIFGHAGLSYSTSISDMNKLISENPDINFTFIGVDEFAKARPSTLFFFSKNGFLGNNYKFIKSEDIVHQWDICDVWITDDKRVVDYCPESKRVIKFNTDYNTHFTTEHEINKLDNINLQ